MLNVPRFRSSLTRSKVEVKYHYKLDSYMRMVRIGSNLGKKFYECPLWHVKDQN